MDLLNKKHLGTISLSIGLLFYLCYINIMDFTSATIVMLISLLLWLGLNAYLDILDTLLFSKILSGSGLILSISIFLLFGIEEMPFPAGAIMFHGVGISISLLVLLLSLLPLLFINGHSNKTPLKESQSSYVAASTLDTPVETNLSDDWELATDVDLESGDYEVAA